MPKYYTQFEDEYGLEVILENTDQEHPTIINQDAYRMFVARLIHINNKYYDKYADKTDPEYAKKVTDSIPVGFYGEPEDCEGIVSLLCSEEGRYITGQNIFVDGGKSVQ